MHVAQFAILVLVSSLAAQPSGFRTETVATGINLAAAFAFAPDGRLFVAERTTGKILVWKDGKLSGTWATVPVDAVAKESRGILGIAVDPDFLRNGFVYLAVANRKGTKESAVLRLKDSAGVGVSPTVIGPKAPTSQVHNIGPLVFGGDGKLYDGMGDGLSSTAPQSRTDLRGKVLRMNVPKGTVPTDNPFSGSYVWSLGLRNPWGLAVHPVSGLVYAVENGAKKADELDLLKKGANYGWPKYEGRENSPDPSTEDPLWVWAPPIGPTGSCFYRGPLYPAKYDDGWFLCDWNNGHVINVDMDTAGTKVRGVSTIHDYQRTVYGVVNGPDGNLYTLYSTGSNRGADRIDRIVHTAAPSPAIAVSATSNVAVGGSVTVGVTGQNGSTVLTWAGARRFASAVKTPFGDWWVPSDIVLPYSSIRADNRVFQGFSVPKDPRLKGVTMHVQAGVARGGTLKLTNADALTLL